MTCLLPEHKRTCLLYSHTVLKSPIPIERKVVWERDDKMDRDVECFNLITRDNLPPQGESHFPAYVVIVS